LNLIRCLESPPLSRSGNYPALTPRRGVRLSWDSSTITQYPAITPRLLHRTPRAGKCESEGVLEETRGSRKRRIRAEAALVAWATSDDYSSAHFVPKRPKHPLL
jgi:hypothetical protein